MSFGIAHPFGAPYFEGVGGLAAVPGVFPIAIAGHPYLIEVAKSGRTTIDALKQAQDVSATPGEAALSTEGAWLKFQQDWHLGAGRPSFDDDDQDITVRRRRFDTSRGVDIWTRNQVTLLPDTTLTEAATAVTAAIFPVGAGLYLANGVVLSYASDPVASTYAVITGTPGGSDTINDLASDGQRIFVATNAGLYVGTAGGASVAIFDAGETADVQGVLYGNGRLIAGVGDTLVEVDNAGAHTAIVSHFSSSFRWTVMAAGPTKLYAGGTLNGVSELYRIGLDDTGALVSEGTALPLPQGEVLRDILIVSTFAVLATSKGVRFASISDDGGLNFGPYIDEPGDCRCLSTDGRYVWFGWTDFDDDYTGLGRLRLDELANDLTPAFASDLMALDQGTVRSVARIGTHTYFVVEGTGVFTDTMACVSTGWLRPGWLDYGVPYDKVWTEIDVRHAPLTAGAAIRVDATESNGAVAGVGTSNVLGSGRPVSPFTLNTTRSERLALTITLVAANDDTSPVLYRWLIQAFVAPGRTDRILLAVILHQWVRTGPGEGQVEKFDTLREFIYLQQLCGTGQVVLVQQGNLVERVRIQKLDQAYASWNDDFTALNAILNVELLTV